MITIYSNINLISKETYDYLYFMLKNIKNTCIENIVEKALYIYFIVYPLHM